MIITYKNDIKGRSFRFANLAMNLSVWHLTLKRQIHVSRLAPEGLKQSSPNFRFTSFISNDFFSFTFFFNFPLYFFFIYFIKEEFYKAIMYEKMRQQCSVN